MIKKSQQKKRTSPNNYKERFFVLDTQDLKYSECRPGKKPMLKGCIQLSRIRCVEIVCSDIPIPCSYKYPFQVFHDNHYLYIFAPDNDCRQRWMELRESRQRLVVALQDYTPQGDNDLPLHKDQQYLLISSSHSEWWTVQDETGRTGFVPSTYVAEKTGNNFERFEWYSKHVTRSQAEDLLMKEGKEGAFMVRDSRQAGVYTVSVFTKAPGSNGEKNPRVKHYQIRQPDTEQRAFYLAEKYLFGTIPELIHYHQHNAADQWEIDPEELILGQQVGSGQFGLVLEGVWRDRKVAVKMVREDCMSDEEFKEEAKIMMRLSHRKLVQLYGVCTQRSPMCLVFELMENGCLTSYLRERRGRVLVWEVYNEGRIPYENRSNLEVVESLNAGLRLLKPRLAPDSVHTVMEWCWKEKPDERPSFALLVHELASLSDL
uniref:Tyrosine-protein kinase n=1 Tax=Nothobranchius furzeri TaxID=105023 RepID=A0A1A8AHD7_NOTFU